MLDVAQLRHLDQPVPYTFVRWRVLWNVTRSRRAGISLVKDGSVKAVGSRHIPVCNTSGENNDTNRRWTQKAALCSRGKAAESERAHRG